MIEIKNNEGDTVAYARDRDTPTQDNIDANGGKYAGDETFRVPKFRKAPDSNDPRYRETGAGAPLNYVHDEPGAFDGVRKDYHTPPHFRFPSTTDELLRYGGHFFSDCLKIAEERNKRYAGAYDPFKNFRLGGTYGIAIRMTDKVSRLLTLEHPSNTVDDAGESIEDTCRDLANYAMLLSAMRANERGGA